MTITSTGPSGFHLKPYVAIFTVVAIAIAAFAIAQVTGTDRPLTTPAPVGTPAPVVVSAEVVAPYSGPSGLNQALTDGKFDSGLASAEAEPFAGSTPVPEVVVVEGHGGLYDALVEGKLTMDNPDVRYMASPGASEGNSSGLWAAFEAGRIDEGAGGATAVAPSPLAVEASTVSGGHQE